jgi:hypothetical protein
MGTKGRIQVRWWRGVDDTALAGRIKRAFLIWCDAGTWVETLYTTSLDKWPQLIEQLLIDGTIEEEVDPEEENAAACWPSIEYSISADQAADGTFKRVEHPTEVVLDLKSGEVVPTPLPMHPRVRKVPTFRPHAEPPAKRRKTAPPPVCQFCSHVGKFRRISNAGGGSRCQSCQAVVRCVVCNIRPVEDKLKHGCNQCIAEYVLK